jgi:hypothetical protein
VVVAALLDAPRRRPNSVTWTSLLAAVVGGATLVCASVIVGVLLTASTFPVLVALVAAVQLGAGMLLVAGGARLAMGTSRRELVGGVVLLFATCGAYAWYAVTEVAGNLQDGPRAVAAYLAVAGAFALTGAVVLVLALHPAAKAHVRGS